MVKIEHDFAGRRADKQQLYIQRRDAFLTDIYNRGLEPKDQKQIPQDDGWRESQAALENADSKYRADKKERARQTTEEIIKLQNQARQAELAGIQLLEAQRVAAEDEWRRTHGNSIAAIKAIDDKYFADEKKLIEEQRRETEKYQGHAALSQVTGIAKIQAQSDLDIADIRGDKNLGDEEKDKRIASRKLQLLADVAEQQRQYTQQVDDLERESESRALTGLARIRAEAERAIAAKEAAFKTQYGQLSSDSAEYQKGLQQLSRAKVIIGGSADQQAQEYLQHSFDETERMQAEAHIHMLSAEKQQTAAIDLEYAERTRQYQAELDHQLASDKLSHEDRMALEDDFNRKVAAAAEQRNAQIVEAARQAREKMAGEFTRFFKNPLDAMKEMGEKAAGETAAALWQRVQGSGSSGQESGIRLPFPGIENWGGGGLSGIFDRIAGDRGQGAETRDKYEPAHRVETMEHGAFTLSHAEIRVAMANISMPAVAAAGGGTGLSSSGSTALFGMPGTFGEGGGSSDIASISGPTGVGGAPSFSGGGSGGGAGIGTALGNAQSTFSLIRQANSYFKSSSTTGASDDLGDLGGSGMPDLASIFGKSKTNIIGPNGQSATGGMLQGGGIMSNLGGAAGGAMGLFSAYEGNGGVGGALGGAMSGMKLGMTVGGPIGAAVGAAAGAIIGAIGFGGREKGRVYDLKTVRPRLAADFQGFQAGSMDYTSAYSDMQALDQESRKTLDKMGGSARAYYWDTINKEIHQAEARLTAEEKAGRSQFTMSAAQYDQGGWAGDFGSMATSLYSGWAHMRRGEFVVTEQPAAEHAGALEAIRAGASHTDMARYYGLDASSAAYRVAMQSGVGSAINRPTQNFNIPINAIDTKDFVRRIHDVKHEVRAALNASYAENSGGADAGY